MSKISIIHPSRQRVDLALKAAKTWLAKAENPENIEYILSIDSTDPLLEMYELRFRAELSKVFVLIKDNKTAIEAINNAAKETHNDLLVVVSDDFECPLYWDSSLIKQLEDHDDFIVKTNDGIQEFIITLPIMDRKYYNRFGYIYHPEYLHMFCDTEMSAVAHMLAKTVYLNLMFPHRHYIVGGMQKDLINIKNDKTWNQGQQVFNKRKLIDFDLKEYINSYPESKI